MTILAGNLKNLFETTVAESTGVASTKVAPDNDIFNTIASSGGQNINLFKFGGFSKERFATTIEDVRLETIERLKKVYSTDNVSITVSGLDRSLEDQNTFLQSGASQSSIGLHQFGGAGDFAISIDGVDMTANGLGESGSIAPYQVLGDVALENDLFWGWKNDLGHVAETRFVDELLKENNLLIYNDDLKSWYNTQNISDEVPAGYRPTLEFLDSMYVDSYQGDRNYVGEERTIDELETPFSRIQNPLAAR